MQKFAINYLKNPPPSLVQKLTDKNNSDDKNNDPDRFYIV